MDSYLIVKTLHILSSTLLFGTGLGIAFFMLRSYFTTSIHEKYHVARTTVLADYCFTLPAVIVQPITGAWLVIRVGYNWTDFWLLATYTLYVLVGLCWLPVVWIQIQLKKIVADCMAQQSDLPARYYRLFKCWFLLGWPAFIGLVLIFFLMVIKPV